MLRLEKICKQFGGQVLFKEAELMIHAGEKVGLIGPNGSGKTSLLRIIQGGECDSGSVHVPARCRVGELRQELDLSARTILEETLEGDETLMILRRERDDLHGQWPRTSSRDALESLSRRLGEVDHQLEEMGSYDAESRAGGILMGLGFSRDELGRPMNAFSGGWRMRVALARLLFARPDLLLLDEPTNHLDLESVAWLEDHLRRLPGTFLVISHDRAFLNRVVQVIVELEEGRLTRYVGNFDRYLELKEEESARLEKQAAQQEKRIEALQGFIRRFRAKATKARQVQSRIKMLDRLDRVDLPSAPPPPPRFRLPEPTPCAREMLQVRQLVKTFGDVPVFNRAALKLNKGDKVGVLGPNGAGKSTLLKLLAGDLRPDGGEIRFGDRVTPSYYAQHALEGLNPEHSILESAEAVARMDFRGETALRSLLGGFLFSGDAVFKRVVNLSGGEKARLALARLFLGGANLLLLDEPTNHLDMLARAALEEALEAYSGTLVLVSHDRDLLEAVCTRYWVVEGGGVVELEEPLESYLEKATSRRSSSGDVAQGGEGASPPRINDRERRRMAGEIRNQLAAKTRHLRQEIRKMEEEIHALEREKTQMDAFLADPDSYGEANKNKLLASMERHQSLNASLERAMTVWEEHSLQLDALESEARAALEVVEGVTE